MPEPRNHMNRYYVPPGHMPPPGAIDMCVARENFRRRAPIHRRRSQVAHVPADGAGDAQDARLRHVQARQGGRADPPIHHGRRGERVFPRPSVRPSVRRAAPRRSARAADDIPKMREMLDQKLIKDINEQPYGTVTTRWSALHFAARVPPRLRAARRRARGRARALRRNGSEEAVKLLLDHGADPFINCRDSAKPIETANTVGHYHIGEILWKKMREMKKPKPGEKFGQLGAWGGAGKPPYDEEVPQPAFQPTKHDPPAEPERVRL